MAWKFTKIPKHQVKHLEEIRFLQSTIGKLEGMREDYRQALAWANGQLEAKKRRLKELSHGD